MRRRRFLRYLSVGVLGAGTILRKLVAPHAATGTMDLAGAPPATILGFSALLRTPDDTPRVFLDGRWGVLRRVDERTVRFEELAAAAKAGDGEAVALLPEAADDMMRSALRQLERSHIACGEWDV